MDPRYSNVSAFDCRSFSTKLRLSAASACIVHRSGTTGCSGAEVAGDCRTFVRLFETKKRLARLTVGRFFRSQNFTSQHSAKAISHVNF